MDSNWTRNPWIDVAWPVVWLIACVTAGVIAVKMAGQFLLQLPNAGEGWAFAIITFPFGVLGLVAFWHLTWRVEFARLGYRVRHLDPARTRFRYEERALDGSIRGFDFRLRRLAEHYAPPCEIDLPSAGRWNEQMPDWARARGPELMRRIAQQLGADQGVSISFVDSAEMQSSQVPS